MASKKNMVTGAIHEPIEVRYTAKTHTTGGREGASRSDAGRLDIKFSRPGGPGASTNPEQVPRRWRRFKIAALPAVRRASWDGRSPFGTLTTQALLSRRPRPGAGSLLVAFH